MVAERSRGCTRIWTHIAGGGGAGDGESEQHAGGRHSVSGNKSIVTRIDFTQKHFFIIFPGSILLRHVEGYCTELPRAE